jgi:hypothetical protein
LNKAEGEGVVPTVTFRLYQLPSDTTGAPVAHIGVETAASLTPHDGGSVAILYVEAVYRTTFIHQILLAVKEGKFWGRGGGEQWTGALSVLVVGAEESTTRNIQFDVEGGEFSTTSCTCREGLIIGRM